MIQSDDRDKLITDKKIKYENPDQDRYISNQFNINPADTSLEGASAGTKEAHDGSEHHGDDGRIDAESQGYKHTLHDQPGNPFVCCRIKPKKILGHHAPIPLIMDFRMDAISDPCTYPGE